MAMTIEKLRSAFLACEAIVAKEGITMAIRDASADTKVRRLSHLLWLSRNGLVLVEEGRKEKANRWLGFLQGALWQLNLVDIDQLKGMNKSDDAEHDVKVK